MRKKQRAQISTDTKKTNDDNQPTNITATLEEIRINGSPVPLTFVTEVRPNSKTGSPDLTGSVVSSVEINSGSSDSEGYDTISKPEVEYLVRMDLKDRSAEEGVCSPEYDMMRAMSIDLTSKLREQADDYKLLSTDPTAIEDLLFDLYRNEDGTISVHRFLTSLRRRGLRSTDPRFKDMMAAFADKEPENEGFSSALRLDKQKFRECVHECLVLVLRALKGQLVIPEWPKFCEEIRILYEKQRNNIDGHNAAYIPQLARKDPKQWGLSICTVDGQRGSWGDTRVPFCIQSVSKAFNYAIVLGDLGAKVVHDYVGQEPSGRLFNEICLDLHQRPHNPMINAGAIVTASLIKTGKKLADRFDYAIEMYRKFAGGEYIGFDNPTFLSERDTADRNFALAHYMREYNCFPENTNLAETLDFYFQLCSVEITAESASVMAATLANGGICPLTGQKVVTTQACRDVLSLMYSCGMYDYSGQFAFKVGLPAKSGVGGLVMTVIPNVMGIATFSPPLDIHGNSCRGVKFNEDLIDHFNFHNYDQILDLSSRKMDPRKAKIEAEGEKLSYLLFAARAGDLSAVRQYVLQGVDVDASDYDGRTAIHVAASDGHAKVVAFLLDRCKVIPNSKDRWGRTPLDDAKEFKHPEIVAMLENWASGKQVKFNEFND